MLYRSLILLLLTATIGTCYGMERPHKASRTSPNPEHVEYVIQNGNVAELNNLFTQYGNQAIINIVDTKQLLFNAALQGQTGSVQILLEKGADPNVPGPTNTPPLEPAADLGYEDIARLLLQYNANPNILQRIADPHIIRGHNPNISDYDSDDSDDYIEVTSLWIASKEGHENIVRLLLQYNANPNIRSNDTSTPLLMASENGDVNIAHLLLQHNANPNIPGPNNITPLQMASEQGHGNIVHLLLQHNADPNKLQRTADPHIIRATTSDYDSEDSYNSDDYIEVTSLWIASKKGHENIVRLLLQHNADPNISNSTPLLMASENGDVNIVHLLLQHNADPNIRDEGNITSLWIASKEGHENIVRLLLQHNADPNIRDEGNITPLQVASEQGHENIVRLLLQHNADPNIPDSTNITPLQMASDEGHGNIASILELFTQNNPNYTYTQAIQNTTNYEDAVSYINMALGQSRRDSTYYEVARTMFNAAIHTYMDQAHDIRASLSSQTAGRFDEFICQVIQPDKSDIARMLDLIAERVHQGTIAAPLLTRILERYGNNITHQLNNLQRQPHAMLYRIFYPTNTQQMLYDLGQRIQNREATPIEVNHAYQKHFDAIGRFRDAQGNTFLHYLAHAPVHASYVPLITARIYRVQNIDITSQTTTDIKNIARRYDNKSFFDNFVDQTEKLRWLHKGYKQDKVSLPPEIQEEIAQYIALPRQSS